MGTVVKASTEIQKATVSSSVRGKTLFQAGQGISN